MVLYLLTWDPPRLDCPGDGRCKRLLMDRMVPRRCAAVVFKALKRNGSRFVSRVCKMFEPRAPRTSEILYSYRIVNLFMTRETGPKRGQSS